MTRTSGGLLALAAALMFMVSPAIASQPPVVTVDPATGLVSVESNGATLQALLEQMSAATPFAVLRLQSDIREQPVHVSIRSVSVKEAVTRILVAAGAGFAISGPEDGNGLRVAAARGTFVETVASSSPKEQTLPSDVAPVEEALPKVKPEDAADAAPPDETADEKDRDSSGQTSEQLVQALTGSGFGSPKSGAVLLPFPAAGGGSMTAIASAPGTIIELPFPGPGGAPLTAVVPPRGAAVQLPIVATPPSTVKPTSKPEGVSPKDDKL